MILTIILLSVIAVGLTAIGLSQPARPYEIAVWSDDVERRLLRERKIDRGW